MTFRRPKGLPVALFGATVGLEVAAIVLSWGLEPRWDTLLYALYSVALAGVGALVARRSPANPIGWLFCGAAFLNAFAADAAQGWALRGAGHGWPGVAVAELVVTSNWPTAGILFVLTCLLFPDGRLPGGRWRFAAWAAVVGALLSTPGWSLDPDIGQEFSAGSNPFAVEALPTDAMFAVGMAFIVAALVASVVVLVRRLRASRDVERQQMKWFTFAVAFSSTVLPLTAIFWDTVPAFRPVTALALTAVPVAAGIAILRYRLYDIDLVISKSVLYAALTVPLAVAYVTTALLLGTALGRESNWATAGATLVVAVGFRPVRDRLQRHIDRRFRRAHHDALRHMSRFLDDLRTGRASPEALDAAMRDAVGDPELELYFRLPGREGYVDSRGEPIPEARGDARERTPVSRGGVLLGEVVRPAGTEQQRALVPAVVEASGLAFEIARLRLELRHQLDEVTASRTRIATAAEDERRRIERDLHDGAQQRLVAIGLALRHAQHALGPSAVPEAGRTLDGAVAEIAAAIEELRELARGVRPAQLDDGLGPALRELAARAPLPVHVLADTRRYAPDVEATAYFTACEGLTNAVKHARASTVRFEVADHDGGLVVRITDDGVGGAVPRRGSGLTGLSDRIGAHGGTLRIESAVDRGTRLVVVFPCAS